MNVYPDLDPGYLPVHPVDDPDVHADEGHAETELYGDDPDPWADDEYEWSTS